MISPLIGIMGTTQALEVLNMLTGIGTTLVGYLALFDAKDIRWMKLR